MPKEEETFKGEPIVPRLRTRVLWFALFLGSLLAGSLCARPWAPGVGQWIESFFIPADYQRDAPEPSFDAPP